MSADQDDTNDPPETKAQPDTNAKDELLEALGHFKRAANIVLDKATSDPTVKTATDEAERVIQKVGDAAEPLARQFAGELSKMGSMLAGAVQDATSRVKETADPGDEDDAADGEGTDDGIVDGEVSEDAPEDTPEDTPEDASEDASEDDKA